MPKITRLPTPAQANILTALATFAGLRILWGNTATWTGINAPTVKRSNGNPKVSVLRRLKREEWIESDGTNFYEITEAGREAVRDYIGEMHDQPKIITAFDVLKIIRKLHPSREGWIVLDEVRVWQNRFIDALAISLNKPYEIIAYEIKVNRSDFLHELGQPTKRIPAMEIANYFYFAVPPGVLETAELPDDCGLRIVVNGQLRTIVTAPYHQAERPTWDLVAHLLKSATR